MAKRFNYNSFAPSVTSTEKANRVHSLQHDILENTKVPNVPKDFDELSESTFDETYACDLNASSIDHIGDSQMSKYDKMPIATYKDRSILMKRSEPIDNSFLKSRESVVIPEASKKDISNNITQVTFKESEESYIISESQIGDSRVRALDSVINKNENASETIIYDKYIEKVRKNRKNLALNDRTNNVTQSSITNKSTPETPAQYFSTNFEQNTTSKQEHYKMRSNKNALVWIGVDIDSNINSGKHSKICDWLNKNKLVRKIRFTLFGPEGNFMNFKVNEEGSAFMITDSRGSHTSSSTRLFQDIGVVFDVYIKFMPKHTGYYTGVLIISVENKNYKVELFGYASPALVEPEYKLESHGDYLILDRRVSNNKNISLKLKNIGSREAFVSMITPNKHVWFTPDKFLLGPSESIQLKMSIDEQYQRVTVAIAYFDEDLRRTAKLCTDEMFPVTEKKTEDFKILTHFGVFNDYGYKKKTFCNFLKSAKYDYRMSLLKQLSRNIIKLGIRLSYTDQKKESSEEELHFMSNNELSVCSSIANVEKLNNITTEFKSANSINGVEVPITSIKLPETSVGKISYCCIFLINKNSEPIQFSVSDPSDYGSLLESETENSVHSSNSRKSASSITATSSVYSLDNVMPTVSSVLRILDKKNEVKANDVHCIPVLFKPIRKGLCHYRLNLQIKFPNKFEEGKLEIMFDGNVTDNDKVDIPEIADLKTGLKEIVNGRPKITLRNNSKYCMHLLLRRIIDEINVDKVIEEFELVNNSSYDILVEMPKTRLSDSSNKLRPIVLIIVDYRGYYTYYEYP